MLTASDIKKLSEVLTTKKDTARLEQKVGRLSADVSVIKKNNKRLEQKVEQKMNSLLTEVLTTNEKVERLEGKVDGLQEMVQSLVISVDKLVKALHDLSTEYAMIKHQTDRHEKWIQEIAGKIGFNLSY